jgi:integrase
MSSLVQQTEHLFGRHRGTGQSRKVWRDRNPGFGRMAPVTFAWNSERRYKQICCHFLKDAQQQYGLRAISGITPDMIAAYIEARRAQGISPRTLATEVTALRRLDLYAQLEGWTKRSFMPPELSVPHGSRPRYSYTPEHAEQIIKHVEQRDPAAAEVLRWQCVVGPRISEAICLRTDRINFEKGTAAIKGKGGKVRVVEIPDRALLDRLDRSVRFPLLHGMVRSWTRHIEKLVAEACMELDIKCLGTHGFRASAAQSMLDDLIAQGVSEREARRQVSRMLGHNRTSVTNSYAP